MRRVALFRGILALANTPKSVFSPIPVFAISLFFLYRHPVPLELSTLEVFLTGAAFSILSVWAANIFNHVNDFDEDRAAGKDNPIIRGDVKPGTAKAFSFAFYLIALAVIGFGFVEERLPALILACLFCTVTAIYSWQGFRFLGGHRLKEKWAGEVLVYAISIPAHTIVLALVYSTMDPMILVIAIPIIFYLVVGLMLKDLKDISADRAAGYSTLGVVFSTQKLLGGAVCSLLVFYASAMVLSITGIVGTGGIVVSIPAAFFIAGVAIPLWRQRFILTEKDARRINLFTKTTYIAIIVWGLGSMAG